MLVYLSVSLSICPPACPFVGLLFFVFCSTSIKCKRFLCLRPVIWKALSVLFLQVLMISSGDDFLFYYFIFRCCLVASFFISAIFPSFLSVFFPGFLFTADSMFYIRPLSFCFPYPLTSLLYLFVTTGFFLYFISSMFSFILSSSFRVFYPLTNSKNKTKHKNKPKIDENEEINPFSPKISEKLTLAEQLNLIKKNIA